MTHLRIVSEHIFIGVLFAVLAGGCDGDPRPDASTPVDTGPSCATPAPFDPATSEGVVDPLSAVGGARAGRIDAADLPADPANLATWRGGDFVLANDRVAVVISAPGNPREAYDPYGGRLVGVSRVEGGALVEPADYNLFLLGLGRYLMATESVGVLEDGSAGPAVIRASGPLTRIEALADVLDALIPGDFEGLPAAMDFELGPDAEHVDIYLSVRADSSGIRASLGMLQAFFQGYRMPGWAEGPGFSERTSGPRYLAFTDDDATSYAWMAPEGLLTSLVSLGGIDIFTSGRVLTGPCETVERYHVGRLVIGGPGLPGLQAAVARLDGETPRALSGRVEEADGGPPTSAVRVHLTGAEGVHQTRFDPAADGSFAVDIPADATEAWAYREGHPVVGPIALGAGDLVITLPAVARIDVMVTATDGSPMPARVELVPGAPLEAPPSSFGEVTVGRGRSRAVFPTDGVVSLVVPPGSHTVRISRGPEYERSETVVDLVAGDVGVVDVALSRVVDTTGVMCADYHIHTHRSVDSPDAGDLKVRGLVADGLEIAVRAEHEWVNDFAPIIESLGLGAWAHGMAGIELTTFTWGHFGVFPLVPDFDRPGGGAFSWYGRNAPEVFADVRARPEAPALIIHHPRSGGIRQGYFIEAGFDPSTGMVMHPELWDEDFSIVEVFNSASFEDERDSTVRDWFALLNMGRRVFAVGSSDSHEIHDTPVGYPRTCLRLSTDDPSAITSDEIRDATSAGQSYVSGGIYLDVTGPGGAQPGDDAIGAGATASFEVVVRAASWVDVDRLEVIVDGVSVETMTIRPEDAELMDVRARAMVDVPVAAGGSWVVFHAAGTLPLPSSSREPFAVSNPVFLTP